MYLGFPAVPCQALPFDRVVCLAKEACLARGAARDAADTLFAARLYGSIADISIKVRVCTVRVFARFGKVGRIIRAQRESLYYSRLACVMSQD